VEIEGRGVFAKVRLTFEFDGDVGGDERLFLLEKPWDAVASVISLNGQQLPPGAAREQPKALPANQLQAVEEALSVPSSHLLVVEIDESTSLSALFVEFILAVDLQWHRGAFHFRSPHDQRQLTFNGRWELSGLPGAGIAFAQAASMCRLETLEGARHRWSEPLTVTPEEPGVIEFSLDEKKAASIAVFSPSLSAGHGCAAVAVVAPVRPQLAREAVRLAIVVEVRNPQEGLLMRSLVEKATSLLKTQDEFSVLLVGTDSPTSLVAWSSSEAVNDGMLAKLLEPSVVGRAPDLWANLQSLAPQLRTSTHLLLATSGAPTYPGKGLGGSVPIFVFATGRRPFKSQLESLSQRSGGFLMEGTSDTLGSLVERMRIRLSPPLLSDFKLEGWALEQLRPSGATQVYTDQPTVVYGLFEGLLPKTVTLSGQSPSRQKLAQRVKVESLAEIDLMPLYTDRVARWDGENDPVDQWSGAGAQARNISHAESLSSHYLAKAPSAASEILAGADTMVMMEIGGPPSISLATSAVAFDDDSFLGAPATENDIFFSQEPTMSLEAPAAFEGVAEASFAEPDLFYSEPAETESTFVSPVIRKAEVVDDDGPEEADLFENPAELNAHRPPPPPEAAYELRSGPPTIFKEGDSEERPPLATAPAKRPEPSAEEPNGKRRLMSWRQRSDVGEAAPADFQPETLPREPSEGWSSEWLETFRAMQPEAARAWLESCSIDHLGLAVSLLEPEVAEDVLGRLDALRQRAVRTQMELGRLLECYECEEADHQLALALTHF
jgi:hypothetical protein